jgi:hypothetical protein
MHDEKRKHPADEPVHHDVNPKPGHPRDDPNQPTQSVINPGAQPPPSRGGPHEHPESRSGKRDDPSQPTGSTINPPVTGGPPPRGGG